MGWFDFKWRLYGRWRVRIMGLVCERRGHRWRPLIDGSVLDWCSRCWSAERPEEHSP